METTFTHKCPNCGGPLLFNPKDQKFHCEYCLNIYTEEEVTRYEQQQHEAHLENPSTTTAEENLTFTAEEESSATQQTETTENETTADAGTMEIFNCPSCGAQIVTDATKQKNAILNMKQSKNTSNKNYKIIRNHCYGTLLLVILR